MKFPSLLKVVTVEELVQNYHGTVTYLPEFSILVYLASKLKFQFEITEKEKGYELITDLLEGKADIGLGMLGVEEEPKQKNLSELVLCHLEPDQPVLIETNFNSSITETDTVESEEETTRLSAKLPVNYDDEATAIFYKAAFILSNILKNAPVLPCEWPLTAEDLHEANVEKMIPSLLFNFLAWSVGETEELVTDALVNTSKKRKFELFSVAQDLLYISSAGRKQTPKHLALAMAVRHVTGSARIISILNGLGHSISHSAVLEYDTDLAQMQLNSID
ncbi:hypothetical protein JTE90_015558 [Oedothorax gibbosus]|uniref:Uncharacterized protein n=1 Tax=Oedothorax gibbosus TaxID=931172 RepID=A0AAV6TTX9_9ARAC|nr:hypothetical protein JTE90_015558 [Oedothorax gibbosus]